MAQLTLVFTPHAVTGRLVVYPGEELEVVNRHLFSLDAQFMV
jgi:hypothetical protein